MVFLFSNCLLHLPSNSENKPLHVYAPRGLYFEIALKYKLNQSKNCKVTLFFSFAFQL